MPGPILDSAISGTPAATLVDSFELPAVSAAGDGVTLLAFTQIRPTSGAGAATITLPGGWTTLAEEESPPGGAVASFGYAMQRRLVVDADSPYADTFETDVPVNWQVCQLAFRTTPAVVTHVGSAYDEFAAMDDPILECSFDDLTPATEGNVLIAYASGTTGGGSGPVEEFIWPGDWTELIFIDLPPGALPTGLDVASVAWKVSDGTETGVEVQRIQHNAVSAVVLLAEIAVESDPLPSPTGPAILYDVYQITAPGDTIEYIATVDDASDKAIRPVRNEPGSGQLQVNRYSPNATADILAPGNLVKVRIPEIHSDHIFAWFMEQGNFQLVASNEQGGEDITIGGRGGLSYWDRAIWLSEKFVIPWWDPAWGTPPAGARGHVTFEAGRYRRYTVTDPDDGPITGYTWFDTAGFEAYFDRRRTYQWPSAGSKRFLVRIMAGETHAGWFVHPHQDGVTETLPSQTVGTSSSILLSDISPDTPGAILYHLFQEGTDPGRPTQPIPLMTIDFTATTDSNGDPWSTTDALAGLTAELGETYLDTIAKLLSTGVIDVEMGPDLDMHAYNGQGRDLTGTTFGAGKVRFVKGVNIADELKRERDDNPVATFIEVVGTDNVIGRAVLPDAASRVARETSGTGDSDVEDVLEALGLASLNARLIRSDAVGFRIATGDNDATGLYLPGPEGSDHGDFWLGDVTTLHTGTGEQDFDQEDERVFAITIAEDDGGNLEVTPEVGSVLGEAERRLYANQSARTVSFTSRSQFSDTDVAEPGVVTAADVEVVDAGGLFTATDVEEALQELAKKDIGYTAHGNTGSTETFDALTAWHSATLNAATVTATFTGATSGLVASMILELAQDGTGGRLVTWPGSVVWPGGVAPTLSTAPGAIDILTFFSRDGGTTWYGFAAGGSGVDLSAIDFLVGTASGLLSGEIVAGTTPGGELGGTWGSPTVDASHSGSTHAATQAAAEATAAAALAAHVAAGSTGGHAHVVSENHLSNGSATTYTLDQAFEVGSVIAWNTTTLARLGVTETQPDQATISAAGSSGDTIMFDYAATLA